jgi:hypothetical protein
MNQIRLTKGFLCIPRRVIRRSNNFGVDREDEVEVNESEAMTFVFGTETVRN